MLIFFWAVSSLLYHILSFQIVYIMSNSDSDVCILDFSSDPEYSDTDLSNPEYSETELSDPSTMDIRIVDMSYFAMIRIGSTKEPGRYTWFESKFWKSDSRILGCVVHETDEDRWDGLVISHTEHKIERLRRISDFTAALWNGHIN